MIFLGPLRAEIRAASWFAALGEPLTDGDRADSKIYADVGDVALVTSWPEAEAYLKSPDASQTVDACITSAQAPADGWGCSTPASAHRHFPCLRTSSKD